MENSCTPADVEDVTAILEIAADVRADIAVKNTEMTVAADAIKR